ncbi:MAG: DnaA regulatory inactivator Hda [Gallionella sp.]|nr:DnaA regulatory inactivator Hda [Gallionella sp.]
MSQLLLDITPDWWPTLDNFVVGGNQELLSGLCHALQNKDGERMFYVWGEHGCGKSHLLQAVIGAAQSVDLCAIYAKRSVPDVCSVVAVDDVDKLSEHAQIDLFNLYNQVRDSGGMLLVSGKEAPQHLTVRKDLRTRLGWGLVYQLHGLSDEEKAVALGQHAKTKGYRLPKEVTQYLLRHGRRDLPSLMAVLDALDAHSLSLHRPPSVPLLKQIMQAELELK